MFPIFRLQDSQISMKMMRGELAAKTTYQRTSKGPVSIKEADSQGCFIALETKKVRKEKFVSN